MKRRHFLKKLGAGSIGLSLSGLAFPAWLGQIQAATDTALHTAAHSNYRSLKVIGIGGAGCNIVTGIRSSLILDDSGLMPEFSCVDLDPHVSSLVDFSNSSMPGATPIRSIPLTQIGNAGGRVNVARAIALRKKGLLRELLGSAEVVFLVAGLGGGTGSGVTPIMAKLARESGALTVAIVVTPFVFEERQNSIANTTLRYLNREADLVVVLSNAEWAKNHDEDTPLLDLFTGLDRHIAGNIHALMRSRFCTS